MPKVWQCVSPEISAILWQLVWCPPEKFSLVTRAVRFTLCLRVRAHARKCRHYPCGVAVSPSWCLYPFGKRKFTCIFIHELFSSSTSINFFSLPLIHSFKVVYMRSSYCKIYIWLLKRSLQVKLWTFINHNLEIRNQCRNYGTLNIYRISKL